MDDIPECPAQRIGRSIQPVAADRLSCRFDSATGQAGIVQKVREEASDWLALFDDALLGQSAVDRFKNNAYDLVIDGESYRSRLKPDLPPLGEVSQTGDPPRITPSRTSQAGSPALASPAIAVVVGEREQSAARIAGAADIRMRAFTLFVRTYDEFRRAVSYLRWHKADVNEIAPSLYLNKGRRKDARAVTPAPTDPGVVPVTNAPIVTPTPGATVPPATAPVPTPFTKGKYEIGTPNAGPFLA